VAPSSVYHSNPAHPPMPQPGLMLPMASAPCPPHGAEAFFHNEIPLTAKPRAGFHRERQVLCCLFKMLGHALIRSSNHTTPGMARDASRRVVPICGQPRHAASSRLRRPRRSSEKMTWWQRAIALLMRDILRFEIDELKKTVPIQRALSSQLRPRQRSFANSARPGNVMKRRPDNLMSFTW
jgi:hypothetical protein